jgi:hypothetical protein
VAPHDSKAKLLNRTNMTVFTLILLISISFVMQMPKTQAATPNPSPNPGLQDKALAFLRDVIQLDMSKYTLTLNKEFTTAEHLFFNLDLTDKGIFDVSGGNAIFSFYNGVLGSCSLSSGYGGLLYLHPEIDPFNATLGMVQRYQVWTNDSQVQEMANMLQRVGSERNATEVSGNLTLRLSVQRYTQYVFCNTFNGADYTGLTIFRGGPDLDISDSRVYQKIGDTSINIPKEQAVNIAENYVKNYYSYNVTLGNGTALTVSNLNVTGVQAISLQTTVKENSTLYPYWSIQLNVSNMQPSGLKGVIVTIWANDGKVTSVYNWSDYDIGPLLTSFFFFPMYSSLIFCVTLAVIFAVAIVVVLLFVLGKNKKSAVAKKL